MLDWTVVSAALLNAAFRTVLLLFGACLLAKTVVRCKPIGVQAKRRRRP